MPGIITIIIYGGKHNEKSISNYPLHYYPNDNMHICICGAAVKLSRIPNQSRLVNRPAMITEVIVTVVKPPTIMLGYISPMR